jgi:hypothetical protein
MINKGFTIYFTKEEILKSIEEQRHYADIAQKLQKEINFCGLFSGIIQIDIEGSGRFRIHDDFAVRSCSLGIRFGELIQKKIVVRFGPDAKENGLKIHCCVIGESLSGS